MARPSIPHVHTSLSTPRIQAGPWVVLLVIALGFFTIILDTTIVNVAIPSMIDGLHASLDEVLWVLNGYILAYAVLLITAGRMGDMFGPKRMFLAGLSLFVLASAACGVAQNPNQLILFRVIQGIGGAILTPQSLSIITSIFPPEKRGAAFGVWASVAGVAAAIGPTLGGYLTTTFSWRAIFYVNVPIGILDIVLCILIMPELTIHRKHRFDIGGVLLSSLGLFAGIFALIEGERYNWGRIWDVGAFSIGSIQASLFSIPTMLVLSVVLIFAFVLWESRQTEPVLPVSLFKDRNFSLANAVSAIMAFGMLGLFFPLTIFLQSVLGLDAKHAGIAVVPVALTSMIIAPIAGRIADRGFGKWVLFSGLILYGTGMGLVVLVASLSATGLTFTLPLIVAGVGMGCTFAPMVTLAMRNVAPSQAGSASGFINTVRQVGGALGTAVVGAAIQHRLATEMHSQAVKLAAQLPASARATFIQGFSHASHSGLQVGRGQTGANIHLPSNVPAHLAQQIGLLSEQVFRHAYLLAMKPSLAISIAGIFCGALLTTFMRSETEVREQADASREGGLAAAGE